MKLFLCSIIFLETVASEYPWKQVENSTSTDAEAESPIYTSFPAKQRQKWKDKQNSKARVFEDKNYNWR